MLHRHVTEETRLINHAILHAMSAVIINPSGIYITEHEAKLNEKTVQPLEVVEPLIGRIDLEVLLDVIPINLCEQCPVTSGVDRVQ